MLRGSGYGYLHRNFVFFLQRYLSQRRKTKRRRTHDFRSSCRASLEWEITVPFNVILLSVLFSHDYHVIITRVPCWLICRSHRRKHPRTNRFHLASSRYSTSCKRKIASNSDIDLGVDFRIINFSSCTRFYNEHQMDVDFFINASVNTLLEKWTI